MKGIKLSNIHSVSWRKGKEGKYEVIEEQREPDYYAWLHLESGYPLALGSFVNLASTAAAYIKQAEKIVPKLRAQLAREVNKRARLSQVITDYKGDSYDLDLLCSKMVEHVLLKTDLTIFNAEMVSVPNKGFWELKVDEHVLLRTRNKADMPRLRKSIKAVLLNPKTRRYFDTKLTPRYADIRKALEPFKASIKDLVNAIDLGHTIEGECELCSAYST